MENTYRHSQTKHRLRRRRRDQRQQPQQRRQNRTSPDRAQRDVAEALGDGAEESGEGQGAIAGEGPGLPRRGDEDGEAHEELDDEEKGHKAESGGFA